MPTYEAIQREVRITNGFVPNPCRIADVLDLSGKMLRVAPNRIDPLVRKYACPAEKCPAIIRALRKLEQADAQYRRISS
jgi:hypothetical protein